MENANVDLIVICIAVFIYCVFKIALTVIEKIDDKDNFKKNILMENEKKRKELESQEKALEIKRNEIAKIINGPQDCPYLANRYADYKEILDFRLAEYLTNKIHPAKKANDFYLEHKIEIRNLRYNNKRLQYQLDFLLSEDPTLEQKINFSTNDFLDAEKEENINNYITEEEQKLSNVEQLQIALNRYKYQHKKTKWQVGIAYERYIGYIYEKNGYDVIFNGALEGLHDLGRDIIAEDKNEILVIQCKYYRKDLIIHENVIFQLYGTMILKQKETNKKVRGLLITTSTLSDVAKMASDILGIEYKENEVFDKEYPCIKCNINRRTGEKIYHLPFDQQYDKIKISYKDNELYVDSIEEAEKLGYRHAWRYHYNTKKCI